MRSFCKACQSEAFGVLEEFMMKLDIMKRVIALLIISFVVIPENITLAGEKPSTWVPTAEERESQSLPPSRTDEILIGRLGIGMPIGRILIVRVGQKYCAMKFTRSWLGETENDHYSSYEFYYQGDGSGNFSKSNVVFGTGELFFPRVRGGMFIFPMIIGSKDIINCGEIHLKWTHTPNWVFFEDSKNDGYVIELSPTPYTSIAAVNVLDSRIRWYMYDESRENRKLSIDQLWN